MGMQVDKTGADDKTFGIRREIRRRSLPGEAEDLSIFQKDIQPCIDSLQRIDDPSVSDQVFHSVPFLLFLSVLTCIVTSAAPCAFAASVVYCPQQSQQEREDANV